MQLSICDVCGIPIKPNDKKYAIAVQEMIEDNIQYTEILDYMQSQQRKYGKIEVKEVCKTCKKIYDRFFQLRKDEIAKLTEEIEKSYQEPKLLENKSNTKEHCTCLYPEPDWDSTNWDKSFLRCKTCGKIINPY